MMIFIEKDYCEYIKRMREEGYALKTELLDIIGEERVTEYINNYIDQS